MGILMAISMVLIAVWLSHRVVQTWIGGWLQVAFTSGMMLYLAAPCIYMMTVDVPQELHGIGVFRVDESYLLGTVAMCSAGIVAFAIGLRCGNFLRPSHGVVNQSAIDGRESQCITENDIPMVNSVYRAVTSLAGLILLINIESLEVSISSYMGNVETTYNNPLFSLAKSLMFLCVAIAPVSKFWLFLLCQMGLVAFGFISSDKDPMLFATLGILYWFIRSKRIEPSWRYSLLASVLLISAAIFISPMVSAFRYYRNAPEVIENIRVDGMNLIESDVRGPLSTYFDARVSDKLRYGATYLDLFVILIPRALWPERPPDIAELYAMEQFGGNYIGGMGFGYSPLAEAVNNFGIYFFFLHFIVLGFSIMAVWRCFLWAASGKVHGDSLVFVFGGYTMLIGCRTPMAGLLKSAIVILSVFGIALAFFWSISYLERNKWGLQK